uniref:Inositol polyphosphate-5-phosphatase n=1 Tax=Iconisemion striatum TaxID=60296 RepID=A0A1A7XV65_9TELE
MAGNGENYTQFYPSESSDKGENGTHRRTIQTSLEAVKSTLEHNEALATIARNAPEEATKYHPRPPLASRLSKCSKRIVSAEENLRIRRLRNSQESLSDRAETGSSTDSLKEDQTDPVRNEQDSNMRPQSAITAGSPVSSLSEDESRPQSQQSVLEDHRGSTKARLSTVHSTRTLPSPNKNFVSAIEEPTNRIHEDYSDYPALTKERTGEKIHRNLSDSKLLENMGSDSASVNSLKSIYSVLSPIKPKDVRTRSFLEGSMLGSGALLGAEELDRYFPDRRVGFYVVTWNMQGGKFHPATLNDLLLPTDSEFAQDFYVIGVQEGCPDKREWETCLQETLGPHYVMLYTASHGVLYLTVFTRRDLIWFCSGLFFVT